jgi:hypothetical protein
MKTGSHSTHGNSKMVCIFPQTPVMAKHFKDVCTCGICLKYFENPMYLKCGYVCCLLCIGSLQKDPHGEGILCPSCSVASKKKDIKTAFLLGRVASKVKELEPQLQDVLQMNPRMKKFQGKQLLKISQTPGLKVSHL